MKFIALFLAIIVFTLTITPCCALEGPGLSSHEIVKEKNECTEQNDECCKDCSPFYVCGTCIGFTFTPQHAVTFTVTIKLVKHDTAYIPVELPLIPLAIWQPPQLS